MHPGDRAAYFRDYGLEKELDKIKRDLNRFRVNFDIWFSETSLYDNGEVLRVLDELRDRNEIYEKMARPGSKRCNMVMTRSAY